VKRIYLDNAATTPVAPEVIEAMTPYFGVSFGNPSSVHGFGQEARAAVDKAREFLAFFLDCAPSEILFTSGGSESDNLAIRGVIESMLPDYKGMNKKPHVVTSTFEHHAVLDTVKDLEKQGKIEATYISPEQDGVINSQQVVKAIRKNTALVSVMYVNNEIGTAQPIREIGKMIEKENLGRLEKNPNAQKIYFHTDAVQAAEYFEMGTKYLHVDLLTMTAHKIYGPKGVGLLFAKKGTPLKPEITGGGQEYKKRAGTENVAGIVGFAKAAELVIRDAADTDGAIVSEDFPSLKMTNATEKSLKLREKLIRGIVDNIANAKLNGTDICRSPNNVNISFAGIEGESILLNLDMLGIAASTGSACTSGSLEPSHVIMALGYPEERAHSSIRFTIGRYTTEEEIDRLMEVLPGIIEKLRKISPIG